MQNEQKNEIKISELDVFSDAYADEITENILQKIDVIAQQTATLQRRIECYREKIQTEMLYQNIYTITEIVEKYFRYINGDLYNVQMELDKIPTIYKDFTYADDRFYEIESDMIHKIGYDYFVESNVMYIKMPIITSSNHKKYIRNYNKNYNPQAGKVLHRLLDVTKIDDDDYKKVCDKLQNKTIEYLYVYDPSQYNIPDSDNHDMKNIQDVICYYLLSNDYGPSCFELRRTVITDRIPSAIYITVRPQNDDFFDINAIIEKWEKRPKSTQI